MIMNGERESKYKFLLEVCSKSKFSEISESAKRALEKFNGGGASSTPSETRKMIK